MRTVPVTTVESPAASNPIERAQGPSVDFAAELKGAIAGVDQLQLQADQQAAKTALGGGNLHELSISLEKADVAMRLATRVRNKVVDAYNEIMRMSV